MYLYIMSVHLAFQREKKKIMKCNKNNEILCSSSEDASANETISHFI